MTEWLRWLADPFEQGGVTYWLWAHLFIGWAILCPLGGFAAMWWHWHEENWAGRALVWFTGAFVAFFSLFFLAGWPIVLPIAGAATLLTWLEWKSGR